MPPLFLCAVDEAELVPPILLFCNRADLNRH